MQSETFLSPRLPGGRQPWSTSVTSSAALCLGFAFPARLRALVMTSTPRLRQNARLLHLALEPLEHQLKRIACLHYNFSHAAYQRDLRVLLLRAEPCDW